MVTTTFLMKYPHRLGGLATLSLGLGLALAACSSGEADSAAAARQGDCFYGCSDSGPGDWDASLDDDGTLAPDAGGDAPSLHALCGVGTCDPDLAEACASGAEFGAEAEAEEALEAAEDAGDSGAEEGEPETPGPGGEPPPEDDAGTDSGGGGGGSLLPNTACHVRPASNGPRRTCEPTGTGSTNAPCMSSSDCAPGLGCTGPVHGGTCQPYCCGDPEACPAQTFCDVRPLRDDADSDEPMGIPVCVAAMNCKLLEQEPCGSSGLICGIVRADGTTSCVASGTGKLDDPCPCAFGYVCAKSTNKCLKLCHVGQGSSECPGGTCQGGTGGLPAGFGVCVGGYQDAG